MGMRLVNSGKAVIPSPSFLQAAIVILTLLIVSCRCCNVEQCWTQYLRRLFDDKIAQAPSQPHCAALRLLSECIRGSARDCHSGLLYHTYTSMAMKKNNEFNCSYIVLHASSSPPVTGTGGLSGLIPLTRPPKVRPPLAQQCSYHGRHEYRYCALFGDPHLRTFTKEEMTCKVSGAWPLVDNAYLAVQVTNEAVVEGSKATATTKVTIIIKGGSTPCSTHKTYEAQVDNLPAAFIDGTQVSGPERSVRVKEKDVGTHVEIHVRYISTTIVVRQVGRYLTLAIRMPKDVLLQGVSGDELQLCVTGCPAMEHIDYKELLTSSEYGPAGRSVATAMERDVAVAKCREYGVTDFYFDSCVFDLMTTGDTSFSQAASKAMHDLHVLNPDIMSTMENRTDLPIVGSNSGNGHDSNDLPDSSSSSNSAPGRTLDVARSVHVLLAVVATLATLVGRLATAT